MTDATTDSMMELYRWSKRPGNPAGNPTIEQDEERRQIRALVADTRLLESVELIQLRDES